MPSDPTVTCKTCGAVVVVSPYGRGFPPDNAKRKLAKLCKANGHTSDPQYMAGLGFRGRVIGQSGKSKLTP